MDENSKDNFHSGAKSENDQFSIASANLTEEGKNQQTIICQRCSSKILKPDNATYVEIEHFLPFMQKKTANSQITEGESLHQYWCVDDIYTFENVGFSNTIGTVKYLTCADCEIGPIGWHDSITQKSYISPKRVLHS